jgi:DNA-binding response OmpR family regulator
MTMFGNILIVEDEKGIRNLVSMYFNKEGFNIYEAEDGEEALDMFKLYDIDLVILDIMIPFINGFEVCRYIRDTSNVPIIILTAKTLEQDILLGFELGADEYVTKPFSPKVLVAKAKAVLKRTENQHDKNDIFSFGGLSVDFSSGTVIINGNEINLTKKEYELLRYLIYNRGAILPKETILDKVWGYEYFGDPRTVDTHIRRLREKLGEQSRFIITVRGRGYRFGIE